jgi:hypothetical protein
MRRFSDMTREYDDGGGKSRGQGMTAIHLSPAGWDPYRTPASKAEFCMDEWLAATKGLVENLYFNGDQLPMGGGQVGDALCGIHSALKDKLRILEVYGCD